MIYSFLQQGGACSVPTSWPPDHTGHLAALIKKEVLTLFKDKHLLSPILTDFIPKPSLSLNTSHDKLHAVCHCYEVNKMKPSMQGSA